MDQLVTEVWGDKPPRRQIAALYVYISQLRRFLDRCGRTGAIVTQRPGYLLSTADDEVDLREFQELARQGRVLARAGRHDEAVTKLEAALALWRGPALGDLRGTPIIDRFGAWLDEARLECVELMVSSGLAAGRHYELVSTLHGLVAEHPLHETFYEQLITALYRTGRRTNALEVYQSARDTLRAELGLEPRRSLRELQRVILTDSGPGQVVVPAVRRPPAGDLQAAPFLVAVE
jgi:DNA-binding SARP family transcriptional activator